MANPADIVDIIQAPVLIKDDFIKSGTLVLDEKGNPVHYTGGFAIVFPFIVNGKMWAFRCWYNSIGNIGKRLKILSEELDKIHLPYFCKFQYVDKGIVCDGNICPTTRMMWVDGQNIKDFICTHASSPVILKKLANSFKRMCIELHKNHIAHGDLQHGNIIVNSKGEIFLIDYDSIFLPALEGEKDIITGLPAYQHPSRIRNENEFANEKLDYFSELIIYLSIIAIADDPSLINDYSVKSSDCLLFCREDYKNLKESGIYKRLSSMGGGIPSLLGILVDYLSQKNISDLVPFEDLLHHNQSFYCIICGNRFHVNDHYCIRCGTKRYE